MLGEDMRHHCVGRRLSVGVTAFAQVAASGGGSALEVTWAKPLGQA